MEILSFLPGLNSISITSVILLTTVSKEYQGTHWAHMRSASPSNWETPQGDTGGWTDIKRDER